MTRSADRMLAAEWSFPLELQDTREFMELIAERLASREDRAPVVVADNVAAYVHDRNPAICLDNYPSLAPPWEYFWIEYPSSSHRQRRGVWIEDITEESDVPVAYPTPEDYTHVAQLGAAARDDAAKNGADPDDVRWVVAFVLLVEQDRKLWGPAGIICTALDANGQVIGNRWSVAPVTMLYDTVKANVDARVQPLADPDIPPLPTEEEIRAMPPEEFKAWRDSMAEQVGILTGRAAQHEQRVETLHRTIQAVNFLQGFADTNDATTWLIRALAPAFQTLAFMHCKNVELDVVSPDAKVQAKRRRNHRPPLVRYHTLRLDLPRANSSSGGGDHRDGKSLHIVAGHFAHYGECCSSHEPRGLLFGRLTGVYWMPTHARGLNELGETHTDFAVRKVVA